MTQTIFFQRTIYPELSRHLKEKQMTIITGMRRVGKTTLLKHLLEAIPTSNKLYIDLQRADWRELFSQKNYENIILDLMRRGLNEKEKIIMALDEIQLMPEIVGVLKYLYDHHNIKFIVTGSSSYYLKNLFTESLSGRKKIFELYPLNFNEFLIFKGITRQPNPNWQMTMFNNAEYERLRAYYEEYIEFGGFPEVVLNQNDTAKKDMLNDIISSYINIDIKSLADFRKGADIYNLIKLLAQRVGAKLDYSKLSRACGLANTTTKNYIDFFAQTYLIFLIPVHTHNAEREIVKAKKIYFCDNGLANILADLDSGHKFENAVFNQLRHKGELRYYAMKNGRELDFVFNGQNGLEVKETPTNEDLTKTRSIGKSAELKTVRLIGRYATPKFTDFIWGGEL